MTSAEPSAPPGAWVSRWVPVVVLLAILARVAVHAAQPLSNPDTWFHLRIGGDLLTGGSLIHPRPLSSFATEPWRPTQWSTELVAALVEQRFGLPGVAWLFGLLHLVLVVTVYAVTRARASILAASVATALTTLAAAPSLSARPQVVSFVLLAVVVAAWLRAHRSLTVPWSLIPLTWVWATAHGLWSLGVVLGAVCWVGLCLDRRLDRRTGPRMLAVPVLSAAAACLTPVGPTLLWSQLAVGGRSRLIGEWQATSFRTFPALAVAAMAVVVVVCWSRRGGAPWTKVLLLLVAVSWAMAADRLVVCAAVVLAPLLAAELHSLTGGGPVQQMPAVRSKRGEVVTVALGATVMLVALALAVPHTARQAAGVPSGFTSRLVSLKPGTPVIVADPVGSWLEWRFHDLDPVMDGMFDGYAVADIERYRRFQSVRPGWTAFVEDSRAEVAVLPVASPLAEAMRTSLGWRVVDHDDQWVYLVPGVHATGPAPMTR